jgi:hypothetical protein
MPQPTEFHPREADEIAAPFVFVYIYGVLACTAALIAWVFYYRGYA